MNNEGINAFTAFTKFTGIDGQNACVNERT